MNWRRGLIRLSIVLTVLWVIPAFFVSTSYMSQLPLPLPAVGAGNWNAAFEANRQAANFVFFVTWIGGVVIWWALLFTGFWIARGFRDQKKQ